jgi:hypothetical protein
VCIGIAAGVVGGDSRTMADTGPTRVAWQFDGGS